MSSPLLTAAQVQSAGRDPAVMAALYRAHRDDVWAYAIRRCRNADDAADLVADVFVEAMTSAARFDGRKGRPVAWLLGIAHHRLVDRHRRAAGEGAAVRSLAGRTLLANDESGGRGPDRCRAAGGPPAGG